MCASILYIQLWLQKVLTGMYEDIFQNQFFFFHMAYFFRAWEDSSDFTRGMLICNTKYTVIVLNHLHL